MSPLPLCAATHDQSGNDSAEKPHSTKPSSSRFSRAIRRPQILVHEEQHLYGKGDLADHDQVRLEAIKVELDQCWDLLRQRDARREFGQDPNEAKVRPPSVVERYKQ